MDFKSFCSVKMNDSIKLKITIVVIALRNNCKYDIKAYDALDVGCELGDPRLGNLKARSGHKSHLSVVIWFCKRICFHALFIGIKVIVCIK